MQGAEQRVQLGEGVALYPEAALQVRGGGFAERRQAQLERVPAHRGIARGARQRLDRQLGRRQVRVSRPDVDDVDPLLHQPPLDGGDLGHGVAGQGGQTLAEPRQKKASSESVRATRLPG